MKFLSLIFRICAASILSLGAVSIVRTTAAQGTDFEVFWRAGRAILDSQSLYSIARDGGMIFKYPPWTATFFIPFAYVSLSVSKWIWGGIELISLVYILKWLHTEMKAQISVVVAVVCLYWGLWIVHALDGQVVLPMLALALKFLPQELGWNTRFLVSAVTLSTKIYTVLPLVSMRFKKSSLGGVLGLALILVVLSAPALWSQPDHSFYSLVNDWKGAAVSSGTELSLEQTRGRLNPGLGGYSLKLLGVAQDHALADVCASLFFAVTLGGLWWRVSRKVDPKLKWLSWLALTPVVHPLPWWHLYIFTFPLSTVLLDLAWKSRNRVSLALGVLGILLITISTEKALGNLGHFLEQNAAKSWGTLLCLAALVYLFHGKQTGSRSIESFAQPTVAGLS